MAKARATKASAAAARKASKPRSRLARVARGLAWLLAGLVIGSVLLVLLLRWINPPTSAIRLLRSAQALHAGEGWQPKSCWMSLAQLGPNVPLAVIATEDQRFSSHYGFDLEEISQAMQEPGGRRRGASTLSQQLSKNLFLWPGRNWLRKGLEVYFTLAIETLWSKRRILEMYLNVVEFGDQRFGACAGARAAFGSDPARLSPYQAALLAASLPNPHKRNAAAPSTEMHQRASWAIQQMRQLGGASYLAAL